MQNFTFFTRASRFKTFESWFLQYIEQTKRMIETHGDITFHHLMIANAILALDHVARYKNWMRNKRVEFPQRLSEIYGDAPKFLNGLLKDIRRLDATWVTHNDNPQVKLLPSQHQKSMITFLTNMLGVDLKEQQMITTPATFTTLKDDKGPCTYCKQDTHTWEQCRNRTQDHQLKKDVGSLHVSLNEQNRLLTKIAEKKVDNKDTEDILTKNLQALARLAAARFKELKRISLLLRLLLNRRLQEDSNLSKKTEMWATLKAKISLFLLPNFSQGLMWLWVLRRLQRLNHLRLSHPRIPRNKNSWVL